MEKLQAKFEVMNKKHQGGPEDIGPDGQPFTQAYFVIRAAQEREELQREVRALKRTCTHSADRKVHVHYIPLRRPPLAHHTHAHRASGGQGHRNGIRMSRRIDF